MRQKSSVWMTYTHQEAIITWLTCLIDKTTLPWRSHCIARSVNLSLRLTVHYIARLAVVVCSCVLSNIVSVKQHSAVLSANSRAANRL